MTEKSQEYWLSEFRRLRRYVGYAEGRVKDAEMEVKIAQRRLSEERAALRQQEESLNAVWIKLDKGHKKCLAELEQDRQREKLERDACE